MNPRKILFNPETKILRAGWRIPWLLLWVAPAAIAIQALSRWIKPHLTSSLVGTWKGIMMLAFISAMLGIYRLFAHFVEHRIPMEIRLDRDTPWHVGLGFLLGGGVMVLIVGILAVLGCYRVETWNSLWLIPKAMIFFLPQSFAEDFLFGLILYRLVRAGLGKKVTLILVPLLFSLAHMGNGNESVLGLVEVVIGGLLMYSALERTGRFWTLWALHFSWNFTMSGIFGLANSGHDLLGFIKPTVAGPVWLTGGATGPEASVLAIGLDLCLLFLLWKMPDRLLRSRSLDETESPSFANQDREHSIARFA